MVLCFCKKQGRLAGRSQATYYQLGYPPDAWLRLSAEKPYSGEPGGLFFAPGAVFPATGGSTASRSGWQWHLDHGPGTLPDATLWTLAGIIGYFSTCSSSALRSFVRFAPANAPSVGRSMKNSGVTSSEAVVWFSLRSRMCPPAFRSSLIRCRW